MNNVESIRRLNAQELKLGIAGTSASWHAQYANTPVVNVGGLRPNVTDERILSVFEQYGVVEHLNIIRDEKTNEARGFAFLAYADARSAVLAVDNLNGAVLDGRTLRVDHVLDYKYPADSSGLTTEYNVRPADAAVIETPASSVFGAAHAKSEDLSRESVVMARLKEMRRMRAAAERAAELEARGDSAAGKRKRKDVSQGTSSEAQQPQRRISDDVSAVHHVDKEKVSLKKQNGKTERRLKRAEIREERRRRRALRRQNS